MTPALEAKRLAALIPQPASDKHAPEAFTHETHRQEAAIQAPVSVRDAELKYAQLLHESGLHEYGRLYAEQTHADFDSAIRQVLRPSWFRHPNFRLFLLVVTAIAGAAALAFLGDREMKRSHERQMKAQQ